MASRLAKCDLARRAVDDLDAGIAGRFRSCQSRDAAGQEILRMADVVRRFQRSPNSEAGPDLSNVLGRGRDSFLAMGLLAVWIPLLHHAQGFLLRLPERAHHRLCRSLDD